jgi:hypothetical protein
MFRAYLVPSSGGTTLWIQQLDWNNPTSTTGSHLKRIISTNCCIHTVVPPDDRPRYARNMLRLTKYTKNKLCNKLVFLYTIMSRYTANITENINVILEVYFLLLPQILTNRHVLKDVYKPFFHFISTFSLTDKAHCPPPLSDSILPHCLFLRMTLKCRDNFLDYFPLSSTNAFPVLIRSRSRGVPFLSTHCSWLSYHVSWLLKTILLDSVFALAKSEVSCKTISFLCLFHSSVW